jgi:hypothetical protein
MKKGEISFAVICIGILGIGSYLLIPQIVKEFTPEEIIRVRVSLENRCTITDDAFVVLDESTNIKTPFYGKIAVLRTRRQSPLRLWMSPNFPQFRYDGEVQKAEENMTMISDCDANPRMNTIMKSMREAFAPKGIDK